MTKTTLYKARTTFLGADRTSHIYFDTEKKAWDFIRNECENGEIVAVEIIADYKLNYSDGCTFDDLTYGNFDAKINEL